VVAYIGTTTPPRRECRSRDQPVDPIVGEDRDAVAAVDSAGPQRTRHRGGALVDVAGAQRRRPVTAALGQRGWARLGQVLGDKGRQRRSLVILVNPIPRPSVPDS